MMIVGPIDVNTQNYTIQFGGDKDFWMHNLREMWRYWLLWTAKPSNDMASIEFGIDLKLTRKLLHTITLKA